MDKIISNFFYLALLNFILLFRTISSVIKFTFQSFFNTSIFVKVGSTSINCVSNYEVCGSNHVQTYFYSFTCFDLNISKISYKTIFFFLSFF